MNVSKNSTSLECHSNSYQQRHLHSVNVKPKKELLFDGGNGEIVTGGSDSCIKVGHFASVQAMTDSFVSTGNHSMVIVGDYSDVVSGDTCTIITGNECNITTGLGSSVCAGSGTVITFKGTCSSYRFCVGDDGIVSCVAYRFQDGQLVPDMGLHS